MEATGEHIYELMKQPWWEELIATYLFLGGLGGMILCLAFYFWLRGKPAKLVITQGVTGIIAVIFGILALILDLGRPERFYLVLISPNLNTSSWIFIGSVLLSLFVVFAILFIAPIIADNLKSFKWLRPLTNLWHGKVALSIIGGIAFILGLGVALYTGILIGVVYSAPFWHTPALPILFLVSAYSTALATYCFLIYPQVGRAEDEEEKKSLLEAIHWGVLSDGLTMLFEILVIGIYILIASYGPPASTESVSMLLTGDLAPLFMGGVLIAGLIVPICLIFLYEIRTPHSTKTMLVTMLSCLLVLIGGFLLRYTVLGAGVIQVPVLT